jgi:hypothetical protein
MILFAADEDFDNDILRALHRRLPAVDIVRIQDVGLSGCDDPTVLEWTARASRVLLTHDVSTMTRYALIRLQRGLPMPGIIAVPQRATIRGVVDDLVLVAVCGEPKELSERILFVPLR